MAVLLIYAYALPEIGFVIATALAAAFLTWRLGTKPLHAIVSGVATSIGIYVVFHLILGLSLAEVRSASEETEMDALSSLVDGFAVALTFPEPVSGPHRLLSGHHHRRTAGPWPVERRGDPDPAGLLARS